MAREFLIVIEKAESNLAAYVPDLPGCVATGETHDELVENIRSAIRLHLKGMQEDGVPVPAQRSVAELVTI